ncbi:MAG: OmpA family protein, partial [Bacteroidota bacterium]
MLAVDQPMSKNPLRLALVAGLGYNFNLGNVVSVAPEITAHYSLTKFNIAPVIKNIKPTQIDNVIATQLRFTLNVSFLPENNQPIPERDLRVFIDTVGTYQSDGNFTLLKALKVEDVQYSELYPLVPYAFYPKNSGEPAAEYDLLKADERGAAAVVLKPDALEINRQLLNVIGSRMKTDFPQSLLKITGTTDGKDETKAIAQQRADFAKDYLLKTFSINAGRITTDARAFPLKPSVTTVAEGDAENRRVEFSSATPELLAPISMAGENERLAYPELVEFRPYAVSADSITEWTLTLSQSGKTLREYKGTGMPKPQRWMIRPNELTGTQIPVDYTFSAGTSGKVFKTAHGSLPVDYISSNRKKTEKLADKTVSKYSLILFDFDKSELTPENQFIVESTILPALKYNSTVKIYGYTDKIGDEKHNKELSLKRAQTVQGVLKAKINSAKYEVIGSGETTELFDNNSPIGRHLSRTVVIVVETPR